MNKMRKSPHPIFNFIKKLAFKHYTSEIKCYYAKKIYFDYWEKILLETLNIRFFRTEFQQSITTQIIKDGKLTINQAKCLRSFYDTLNQNEKTAFRKIVSIKLRKDKHKDQYKDLTALEKSFIFNLLNTQQKKRMRELYEG